MVYTQHLCAKCGSEHIRRNGSSQGHAQYECQACGHRGRFVPAAAAKAAPDAQVEKRLGERNSPRRIGRATGVSRRTIAKWLKKSPDRFAAAAAAAAEKGPKEALASP